MELTAKQVAEKLNLTPGFLRNQVRKGNIQATNYDPKNPKKVNYKFDSKYINSFAKENIPVSRKSKSTNINSNGNESPNGIMTRLNSIESKLDRLIKLWVLNSHWELM